MFNELAAMRAERGYRVVSYDQRGQGGNPAATREEVSVDALTEDIVALIGALGVGRVHVAGDSLGGFVALRLAARHPDLLISAAAIGSSAEQEHSLAAFAPLVDHLTEHGAADIVGSLMQHHVRRHVPRSAHRGDQGMGGVHGRPPAHALRGHRGVVDRERTSPAGRSGRGHPLNVAADEQADPCCITTALASGSAIGRVSADRSANRVEAATRCGLPRGLL